MKVHVKFRSLDEDQINKNKRIKSNLIQNNEMKIHMRCNLILEFFFIYIITRVRIFVGEQKRMIKWVERR